MVFKGLREYTYNRHHLLKAQSTINSTPIKRAVQMIGIKEIPNTVYKDECGYCFKNEKNRLDEDAENILNLCLNCFQAFCNTDVQKHLKVDNTHNSYLKYYKRERAFPIADDNNENKKAQLEIANDLTDGERYETFWQIGTQNPLTNTFIAELNSSDVENEVNIEYFEWIENILKKKSVEFQEQNQQWKLEVKTCKHAADMEKNFHNKALDIPRENLKCEKCDLNDNLWICLHCGKLGCGREQVGLKGYSHAIQHQKANPAHCLVVKLGSLTDRNRDIYCYECEDETSINESFENSFNNILLANVKTSSRFPTEKTLSELNVEQNMKWDFKMTDSSGKDLTVLSPNKVLGTGLLNLGNSCYFNTVIQAIFNGGIGIEKYNIFQNDSSFAKLMENVVYVNTNAKIQLNKLIEAIQKNPEDYQNGVKPLIFKKIVSSGNEEFCSGRQQDAMEFFIYFLNYLDEKILPKNSETTDDIFRFNIVNKLFCSNGCNQYKLLKNYAEQFVNIPLIEDLEEQSLLERFDDVFASKTDMDFRCPSCSEIMESNLEFESFPETLILNPTRIKLVNWQPTKTNSRLSIPDSLDLSEKNYVPVAENLIIKEKKVTGFEPDETLLEQLIEFSGFSRNGCVRALQQTNNNSNLEIALNWMFEHLEDSDFNLPLELETSSNVNINKDSLMMMESMGLPSKLCIKGLHLKSGNMDQALDWVFNNMDDDGTIEENRVPTVKTEYGKKLVSGPIHYTLSSVICHKGNSVHSGHYVIFIKKLIENVERWVLYNDEKIKLVTDLEANEIEDIQKNGYIYIYKKV